MTPDDPETVEDAAETVVPDDPETSPMTIIERSESEAASGDGGPNAAENSQSARTAPFARSSFFEPHEKPSKNRLARKHRRLYPTKLLHNARYTMGLSVCDSEANGRVVIERKPLASLEPDPSAHP